MEGTLSFKHKSNTKLSTSFRRKMIGRRPSFIQHICCPISDKCYALLYIAPHINLMKSTYQTEGQISISTMDSNLNWVLNSTKYFRLGIDARQYIDVDTVFVCVVPHLYALNCKRCNHFQSCLQLAFN